MSLLAEIARQSLLAFAAVLFVLQIAAREAGYAIGRRHATPDAPPEGVGVVVTGMLGLLQERTYAKYGPCWREGVFYTVRIFAQTSRSPAN